MTGSYNIDQGTFTAQLYLTGQVNGVTATVTGSITTSTVLNRAPHLGTPTVTNTASTGAACESQVGFTVPATDLDGDSLTFHVSEVAGSDLYTGGVSAGSNAAVFSANLPVGKHQIFIQVDDGKGGSDSLYQTVVVVDGTPPQFAKPPKDIVSGVCGSVDIGGATAVDNCGTGAPVQLSNDAPATFPLGTTTVTWTATDTAGNTATYKQNVTVAGPPKFVSTPPDITYTACDTPPNIGMAKAVDICGTSVSVSNNAPSTFPIGTTTVVWTAVDTQGNTATYSQKVTVSATDLGAEHNVSSVANNACLKVTQYPSSWAPYVHSLIIQPQATGTGWPIPFNWRNCNSSGASSMPAPWQQSTVGPMNTTCPTMIKLGGNGAGSVSLTWWANG